MNLEERKAKATELLRRAKEKGQALKQQTQQYAEKLEQKIWKNPVKSTIIAGISGLILGKFLKKK
jgi:ElaB/YqjD/DUF883 family membrane-anchored ribosome-binding protein